MVNNNMMNNNQLKPGISGNVLNNPINRSNSNNIVNLEENNEQIRNTFGNSNINIKKIPPEVNNNISLQRANAPINNMIPNAASFNRNVQNLNELNNNPNNILPSRNININISPNNPTPIINTQQQINYNLNNQIMPQIPPKDILADSANPEIIKQKSQEEINTKEYEEHNDDNIEQNEENDNVLQDEEPNPEQNIQENEDQYIEQKEEQNEEQNADQNEVQNEEENQEKKDPNISYNEFDFTGLLKNYGGLSRQGIDANGNQKTNQDTLVSLTNINKIKDFNIFGVLDGHGVDGHHVSNYASEFIPSQIINNPDIKELSDPELIYQKLKENNCQIITEAFLSCDEQLKNAEFDAYGSGSTCILIIHIGQHILCANVGDSRALVAYDDNKEDQELKYLEQAQLSIDYKPDLEEEKNRILLSGGVVEQMQNQFGEGVGPYRVWVKGEDYPGLAMSRSIGDLKGKTIGVISEPGILEYDVNETTKFVVIASDGVWEFLRNETVLEIGKEFYINNDTSALCHKIVDASVSVWQEKDVVVDDITVVVMFF
jgi:serine/threonine protein phosphatase PrpC